MKTRLERMCEALGWQGGTLHQVIDELKKLKIYTFADETWFTMSDERFYTLTQQAKSIKERIKRG